MWQNFTNLVDVHHRRKCLIPCHRNIHTYQKNTKRKTKQVKEGNKEGRLSSIGVSLLLGSVEASNEQKAVRRVGLRDGKAMEVGFEVEAEKIVGR